MTSRKCYKKHNTDGICSSGVENRIFGWMRHDFYCPECNKVRTLYSFWFKRIVGRNGVM